MIESWGLFGGDRISGPPAPNTTVRVVWTINGLPPGYVLTELPPGYVLSMPTASPSALCPDLLRYEQIGAADNLRGRVIRGFFWLMRAWPT